mgnify:CR=1 FL=1
MLEEMVASVMKKTLAQDFPHLKLPAAVFATIDSAAKSDAFDIEELIVHNEVTGEVFKAHSHLLLVRVQTHRHRPLRQP